jgi:hypothetical protein
MASLCPRLLEGRPTKLAEQEEYAENAVSYLSTSAVLRQILKSYFQDEYNLGLSAPALAPLVVWHDFSQIAWDKR